MTMSKTPVRDDRFAYANPPSGKGPDGMDSSGTSKDDIPRWMMVLVIVHVVGTYGIIITHGLNFVPFHLEDAPLTALVAAGIGSSLGLVAKRITKIDNLLTLSKGR